MADISVIPSIIGDTIAGASRAAAAIGRSKTLQSVIMPETVTAVTNHLWDKAKESPIGAPYKAVDKKAQEFKDESLGEKVSDVADLATIIPVGGAAAAGAKAVYKARLPVKTTIRMMKNTVKKNAAEGRFLAGMKFAAKDGKKFLSRARQIAEKGVDDFGTQQNIDGFMNIIADLGRADKKLTKQLRKAKKSAKKKKTLAEVQQIPDKNLREYEARRRYNKVYKDKIYDQTKDLAKYIYKSQTRPHRMIAEAAATRRQEKKK